MTQAPVKPLVDANQIRAYAKALSALDESDLLVVLGYSFYESDRHVAAIVHDYVTKPGKRLIYMDHSKKLEPADVKRLLGLDEEFDCNIKVMGTGDEDLADLEHILG